MVVSTIIQICSLSAPSVAEVGCPNWFATSFDLSLPFGPVSLAQTETWRYGMPKYDCHMSLFANIGPHERAGPLRRLVKSTGLFLCLWLVLSLLFGEILFWRLNLLGKMCALIRVESRNKTVCSGWCGHIENKWSIVDEILLYTWHYIPTINSSNRNRFKIVDLTNYHDYFTVAYI